MTDTSPLMIQKLRLQRGWSQEQLAELAGLSVRTVQRIERGRNPSAESLKAIAAVLDVDFGDLREAHMTATADQNVSADEALRSAKVRKIKGLERLIAARVRPSVNARAAPNRLRMLGLA